MKRLLLVSICICSCFLLAGCGDDNVPSGTGGALALGDACNLSDDKCGTGLLCHDAGTGPVCHTECDPAEWPSPVCSTADQACGASASSGACVAALAQGADCDIADDLCGADAHCADITGGTDHVCVDACSTTAECGPSDACFVLGFLTGGTETERLCATALAERAACDAAETYCGAGMDCIDAGEGSDAICWRTCNPDGDGTECGSDACVPEDYFMGSLEAAGGICTPYITTGACDRFWDICAPEQPANHAACADVDGTGYTCQRGCDLVTGSGCAPGARPDCVPVDRVNPGSDPTLGVCIEELNIGDACLPEADRCPEFYGCAGDLTVGYACRQHIGNGLGACLGDQGQPCLLNDHGTCPGVTCDFGCPDIAGPTQQVHVAIEGGDDEYFCIAKDGCQLAFEGADSCAASDPDLACVAFPALDRVNVGTCPNQEPCLWELVHTCVEAGTAVAGDNCSEATRCEVGSACIPGIFGRGVCREICDSSSGNWTSDCSAQGTSGNTCDSGGAGCCVDMQCFNAEAAGFGVGVRLPDFGPGCDMQAQDNCQLDETCIPQAGAWDRPYCQQEAGTAGPGDECLTDGAGSLGCSAGTLCLPFFGDTPVCVQVCDPTAVAPACAQGTWQQQTNCIDVFDFADGGPPDNTIGLCLPLCDNASDCALDQTCMILPNESFGFCMTNCDAGTDQGGPSAECVFGSVCIHDLENAFATENFFAGTGTCDATAIGGVTLCDVATRLADCGTNDSQCVEVAGLESEGFCATYVGAGESSCNTVTGARCDPGESCYLTPTGQTFCAEPLMWPGLPTCDPTTGAPCNDVGAGGTGTSICVPAAGFNDPNNGPTQLAFCMPLCDHSPSTFGTDPVGSCALDEICYSAGTAAWITQTDKDGFCASPGFIPGAPILHCDGDLANEPDGGFGTCAGKVGMPPVCGDLAATTHRPTIEPEGVCVARCFVGATGHWGSCRGDPAACVTDADTSGLCLNPDFLGEPCNIIAQTGCDWFESCIPDFLPLAPGGIMTTCSAEVGLAQLGDDCDRWGDVDERCEVGLFCIGDSSNQERCVAACDPFDPDCGTGFACVDVSRAYFDSAGHVGACMVDDGCDLIVQDCSTDETCALVGILGPLSNENHALQCIPSPGTTTLGSLCLTTWENGQCDEGTYCGVSLLHPVSGEPLLYCTSFCDPTTAVDNTACDGGVFPSRLCRDVSDQFNASALTYGVCTVD